MTDKEGIDFIAFLINEFAAEFVPERSIYSPPFPRYKKLSQVRELIERDENYFRFFVLSHRWEVYPLKFDEIKANDGRHFFSVSQRYGGPAFDLILSRTRQDSGLTWIVPGSFSDYPYYYVPDDFHYETFDRPETMKQAYNEVQKYLRRHGCRSTCKEDGKTGPWVLAGAVCESESGVWLRMGNWHFEPKTKKRKPTSCCS